MDERVLTSGELAELADDELLNLARDPQSLAGRQVEREIRRRDLDRRGELPSPRMITVRLSQAERLLVGRAAAVAGQSVNAWCVQLLVDAALQLTGQN